MEACKNSFPIIYNTHLYKNIVINELALLDLLQKTGDAYLLDFFFNQTAPYILLKVMINNNSTRDSANLLTYFINYTICLKQLIKLSHDDQCSFKSSII